MTYRITVPLRNLYQCRYYKTNSSLKEPKLKDPSTEVFGKRLRKEDDIVKTCVENDLSIISAVPEDYHRRREAIVSQRPKNVMQQGTDNTRQWELQYNTEQRWENPLMGWCSSGDSLSNICLEFPDAESAKSFAKKEGFKVNCGKPHQKKAIKKSYAENFTWKKRTRVSTK